MTLQRVGTFLLDLARDRTPVGCDDEITLELALPTPADVYTPRELHGTLVLLHGMTEAGPRDVRIQRLARAFSVAGYRVVVPLFDTVRRARICPGTVDEVEMSIAAVRGRFGAVRVGLVGPSFSGGLGLLAASRPGAAQTVSAVCAIGAFFDPWAVVEFLLLEDGVDPYGRYVVLKNYLSLVDGPDDEVEDALGCAIADDKRAPRDRHLPACLERISPRARARFLQVTSDTDARSTLVRQFRALLADHMTALRVDPADVQVPLVLVHGTDDDVIPASESRTFHRRVRETGGDSTLAITSLLTHGDVRLGPRALVAAVPVVRALHRFMSLVDEGARPGRPVSAPTPTR